MQVRQKPVSQILIEISENKKMHGFVTINTLLTLSGHRTFGLALLFFSLPNVLPTSWIPGVSVVTGMIIAIFSLQLIFGRTSFWLPKFIKNKKINHESIINAIDKIVPYFKKLERFIQPRLDFMYSPFMNRVTGFIILSMSILLMPPIPFTIFAIGVIFIIFSLGLITKDGIFILIGYAGSFVYISFILFIIFSTISFLK